MNENNQTLYEGKDFDTCMTDIFTIIKMIPKLRFSKSKDNPKFPNLGPLHICAAWVFMIVTLAFVAAGGMFLWAVFWDVPEIGTGIFVSMLVSCLFVILPKWYNKHLCQHNKTEKILYKEE